MYQLQLGYSTTAHTPNLLLLSLCYGPYFHYGPYHPDFYDQSRNKLR